MFGEQYGLINNILGSFGIDPILWKNETLPGHIAIATMVSVIVTASIGGLQIFTKPRLFDPVAAGGTQRQFQTTVLYLREMVFQRQNF